MIPVEYMWLMLIGFWGLIGSARGLAKEIGASAILMLSLFTLFVMWDQFITRFVGASGSKGGLEKGGVVLAAYFGIAILIVAYISYEGVVLSFPLGKSKGLVGTVLGYLAGLVNGYLIVGTIWNVVALADYFQPKIDFVSCCLSNLHNTIVSWLPVSLMDRTTPFIFLVPGMFLLLLIVIK